MKTTPEQLEFANGQLTGCILILIESLQAKPSDYPGPAGQRHVENFRQRAIKQAFQAIDEYSLPREETLPKLKNSHIIWVVFSVDADVFNITRDSNICGNYNTETGYFTIHTNDAAVSGLAVVNPKGKKAIKNDLDRLAQIIEEQFGVQVHDYNWGFYKT